MTAFDELEDRLERALNSPVPSVFAVRDALEAIRTLRVVNERLNALVAKLNVDAERWEYFRYSGPDFRLDMMRESSIDAVDRMVDGAIACSKKKVVCS